MSDGSAERAESVSTDGEIARLRDIYETRDAAMPHRAWEKNIYHPRHPLGHLFQEHNHDALVRVLNRLMINLEGLDILDVGCGYGHWLRYLVDLGADPKRLAGIDLSEQRIASARAANPAICWIHEESEGLPFPPSCFNIVLQSVVFSSILEKEQRAALANEMWRVARPGGLIFWVDQKKDVGESLVGFSKKTVCEYFPQGEIVYARSVHPRYFRKLYGYAPGLAQALYRTMRFGCESWFLAIEVDK